MPNLDLTDDEHAALVRLVKPALDTDRFPVFRRDGIHSGRPLPKLEPQPLPRARVTTQGLRTAEGQRSPEMAANGDLSHDSRRTDARD